MRRALLLAAFALVHPVFSAGAASDRDLRLATEEVMVSEARVALVIGNGAYRTGPLKNPPNDARALAAKLTELGFDVTLLTNLDYRAMNIAIVDFGKKLKAGGVGLFYYAGHGIQSGGRNYLIPVDADISEEAYIRAQAVDVDLVLAGMAAARNRVNLMVLDACRNNPFERSFRSGAQGLSVPASTPRGTLIAYATGPGNVAEDGVGQPHSSYTAALIDSLGLPGVTVENMFKGVRLRVEKATTGRQTPWETSSLTGEFCFKLPCGSGMPVVTPSAPIPGSAAGPQVEVSGGQGSYAEKLAQRAEAQRKWELEEEAARKEKAAAEALAKKAEQEREARLAVARKAKEESDARLAAERRAYFDEAASKVRKEASTAWKATQPVLAKGGKEAQGAAQDFIKAYGVTTTTLKDSAGSYSEKVEVPVVALAQAWLGRYREDTGGAMDTGGGGTVVGKAGIEWVRVPGGSFQMGSNDGDSDEKPVHTVRVRAFEMSRTEVTVAQYAACVSEGVCTKPNTGGTCTWGVSGKEDHPVNCVDWNQASTYAKWAGGRLPTEAEWEYAARGGQSYAYAGSSNVDEVAWYVSNSGGGTHPVGRKKANGYGLYDMSGNVWEWVQDLYHSSYTGASADGSAWESGGSLRVPRGGSWGSGAGRVRVADRYVNDPGDRFSILGFRLSRSGS